MKKLFVLLVLASTIIFTNIVNAQVSDDCPTFKVDQSIVDTIVKLSGETEWAKGNFNGISYSFHQSESYIYLMPPDGSFYLQVTLWGSVRQAHFMGKYGFMYMAYQDGQCHVVMADWDICAEDPKCRDTYFLALDLGTKLINEIGKIPAQ